MSMRFVSGWIYSSRFSWNTRKPNVGRREEDALWIFSITISENRTLLVQLNGLRHNSVSYCSNLRQNENTLNCKMLEGAVCDVILNIDYHPLMVSQVQWTNAMNVFETSTCLRLLSRHTWSMKYEWNLCSLSSSSFKCNLL